MSDPMSTPPPSYESDSHLGTSLDSDGAVVGASETLERGQGDASTPKEQPSVSISKNVVKQQQQTGIKPPSRIGRPCAGHQKPAIPATPTKNVLEEDDPASDRHCRPSSTSPHRGRYSPHASVILTEDTDSFIIGERVWVGGNKPGVIAFIGETQFAPGEWAGIALDEPIGKNDGSVAGIKYFQCEPKKGVFSRLTRLTRVPLDQPYGGSSDFSCSTPLPTNGIRKSSVSPTSSIRSLQKSPVSLSTSNTSLTSAASHSIDFRIGDRVIIKSSQGSKVGIVRYIGLTDFAPGEWIGVELDDPRGKNDGTVEGKRYFECRPNFGLFAPIAKVSKSPLKYKPGSCQIHSGGPGLPPTGMRRANSKESMTSMTSMTSATSSVRRVRLGVTSLTPKKAPLRTSMTPRPSMQVW